MVIKAQSQGSTAVKCILRTAALSWAALGKILWILTFPQRYIMYIYIIYTYVYIYKVVCSWLFCILWYYLKDCFLWHSEYGGWSARSFIAQLLAISPCAFIPGCCCITASIWWENQTEKVFFSSTENSILIVGRMTEKCILERSCYGKTAHQKSVLLSFFLSVKTQLWSNVFF